ncbi:hypothetical protein C8R45DRAFT_1113146 [Mycena sanguinolenta]|nr:hypothetical protein C8R45DRAFT_1113146 [Mycena sanguinolenta]
MPRLNCAQRSGYANLVQDIQRQGQSKPEVTSDAFLRHGWEAGEVHRPSIPCARLMRDLRSQGEQEKENIKSHRSAFVSSTTPLRLIRFGAFQCRWACFTRVDQGEQNLITSKSTADRSPLNAAQVCAKTAAWLSLAERLRLAISVREERKKSWGLRARRLDHFRWAKEWTWWDGTGLERQDIGGYAIRERYEHDEEAICRVTMDPRFQRKIQDIYQRWLFTLDHMHPYFPLPFLSGSSLRRLDGNGTFLSALHFQFGTARLPHSFTFVNGTSLLCSTLF